jgi:hypothetical protein
MDMRLIWLNTPRSKAMQDQLVIASQVQQEKHMFEETFWSTYLPNVRRGR